MLTPAFHWRLMVPLCQLWTLNPSLLASGFSPTGRTPPKPCCACLAHTPSEAWQVLLKLSKNWYIKKHSCFHGCNSHWHLVDNKRPSWPRMIKQSTGLCKKLKSSVYKKDFFSLISAKKNFFAAFVKERKQKPNYLQQECFLPGCGFSVKRWGILHWSGNQNQLEMKEMLHSLVKNK